MTLMGSGIYIIQNTRTLKCYVGSAVNLRVRDRDHFSALARSQHENPHLQASFNKHGRDAFRFWVAEECSREQLIEREQWWLDMFEPVYNICKKAYSHLGMKRSVETRQRMSVAHRGHSRKGYVCSAETAAKISAARTGRPHPHKGGRRQNVPPQENEN